MFFSQLSPQLKFVYFTANMLRFVSSGHSNPLSSFSQNDVAADIEEIVDQWEMVDGVSVAAVVVGGSLCFCTQIYGLISSA